MGKYNSTLAKKQENREKGEKRTHAALVDRFWVLERPVDVEGADFLVQMPAKSLEELFERKNRIEVFGIIQSKYFENNNIVKVSKKYIRDNDGNFRTDFFAFLHTDDKDGEHVSYFFTAKEVHDAFYVENDGDGDNYCFSITNTRKYEEYKNRKGRFILDIIEDGMRETSLERNRETIAAFQDLRATITILPNERKMTTETAVYSLSGKDGLITLTKKDKSTDTESVLSSFSGELDDVDYDPSTDTYSVKWGNTGIVE